MTIHTVIWSALILVTVALGQPFKSARERDLVAAVLVAEAGGEGQAGMTAVAEVIARRARIKNKTPLDILTPGAFECLKGTSLRRLYERSRFHPKFDEALVISKNINHLPGISKGATHYCRINCNPDWADGLRPLVIIGRHKFFRVSF